MVEGSRWGAPSPYTRPMIACPACAEQNPAKAKFCRECGAALRVVESRGEERKMVTVLFVDLVGFTSRTELLDAEDVRGHRSSRITTAAWRVGAPRWQVEKFIGDAVMAHFWCPDGARGRSRARGPRRSWRSTRRSRWRDDDRRSICACASGSTRGEALVAWTPPAGGRHAVGDVVNTAARLQSAAPLGRRAGRRVDVSGDRTAIAYETAGRERQGEPEPVRGGEGGARHVRASGSERSRAPPVAAGRPRARAAGVHVKRLRSRPWRSRHRSWSPMSVAGHRQDPAGPANPGRTSRM